jgi:vitamin B12 transporter
VRQVPYTVRAAAGVIISPKKSRKESSGNGLYEYRKPQLIELIIVPKTTIKGFSVNGNLDKFNYYASLNSTETTGISEAAVTAPTAYESDRFPE